MKKIVVLLGLFIMFSSLNGYAQYFNSGIKFGMTFSKFRFDPKPDDDIDRKALLAPSLGFKFEFGVTDNVFVNTEIRTCAKGFKAFVEEGRWVGSDEDGDWYDSQEYQFIWYLGMPIMAGYKAETGNVKLYGMAGPVIDFGMYATNAWKAKGEWDNEPQKVGKDEDGVMKEFKAWDIGFGAEFGLQVDRFQIGLFYTHGFSNVSGESYSDIIKTKTNLYGLNVAILFGEVDGGGRGYRR